MTKDFFQEQYRFWPSSMIRGICHVRSAGHYIVHPGFRGVPMKKDFFELFWSVRGCGYFKLKDEICALPEGKIFCYFPGDYHDVFSGEERWEYYWMTMDGEDLSLLLERFGFSHEVKEAGSCPVDLFNNLISLLAEVDAESARLASARCYELLSRAANPVHEKADNLVVQFKKLVAQEYNIMGFSVEEAAFRLGVHRSSLHRIFRADCGLSPKEYLFSFRIQQAMNQLLDGHPIKELAEACGFSGTNYFTKAFRQRFGMPPAKFRDQL